MMPHRPKIDDRAPRTDGGPPQVEGWDWGLGAWLLGWMAIAGALRFWHLDLKPPSSIEIATVGFGLGNGFGAVTLDGLVAPAALLEALRWHPNVSIAQLLDRLAAQSTHPPLFFLLMRGWLAALTPPGAVVTLAEARSFSAVLGVLAVPLAAGLGTAVARSRRAGIWAAPLMALSPYGVYLSQEARHYTLAVLLAMGSWMLAVRAARRFSEDAPHGVGNRFDNFDNNDGQNRDQNATNLTGHTAPLALGATLGRWGPGVAWVLLNGLGMATHYLYGLTIATQGLLFGALAVARSRRWGWRSLGGRVGAGLGLLAAGHGAAIALWIPFVQRASQSEMTEWVGDHLSIGDLPMVPLRLLLWLLSMGTLLPVEHQPWPIAVASGLGLLAIAVAGGRLIWQGFQRADLDRVGRWTLGAGVGGALLALVLMAYGGRADLSVAPRYQFAYFPLVITAIAVALQGLTKIPSRPNHLNLKARSPWAILLLGAIGSVCVVHNLGFQKSVQGDRIWATVAAAVRPNAPVVMVVALDSLSEVRSAIALATEAQRHPLPRERLAMMLLSDRADTNRPDAPLGAALRALPPTADLWTLGDDPHFDLTKAGCQPQPDPPDDLGERLRHFHCDRAT